MHDKPKPQTTPSKKELLKIIKSIDADRREKQISSTLKKKKNMHGQM